MKPQIHFALPSITSDDLAAVRRVMESRWLTTGDECRALEEELRAYLACPHVICVSSCTAALEIALAYLGLPPAARVGVPTWTFVSTALSVVHAGGIPVL